MPEPTPPTRRRWFRFGLRSLLVFTTLVGLLMGWIVKERRQSAREMEIAKQLRAEGWEVALYGRFQVIDLPVHVVDLPDQSWWRKLGQQVLGDRIFYVYGDSNVLTPVRPTGCSCVTVWQEFAGVSRLSGSSHPLAGRMSPSSGVQRAA